MTAILISTFDRYARLAEWTAGRIDEWWSGHPPVFFSGLSARSENNLPFDGDSKDWMRVTFCAVRGLREKGFTSAYLILDDHPPMGPCGSEFLNRRLPDLSVRLEAAYVGLLGYGQHRGRAGKIVEDLEHSDPGYRWKFSLHPGLWNLRDLETLLLCRMALYPPGERSPWNFERHRDVCGEGPVGELGARCYRIRGSICCLPTWRNRAALAENAALRLLVDAALFGTRLMKGMRGRNAMELRWLWAFGHYVGPYPIFWSGCLRQGVVHADFEKWLEALGNASLRERWNGFRANSFLV